MKKVSVVVLFIGSFFAVFAEGEVERGNGDIITSERTVSSFDKISNASTALVRFHASEECRITVTADSNLEEVIEAAVENGELKVEQKSGPVGNESYVFTQLIVDVYAPALTGISITGSGSFESIDQIVTPNIEIVVSGSGTLEGNIASKNASVRMSGSGEVKLAGDSENFQIAVSGSGSVIASQLRTANADVRISGSGNADVWAEDNIRANISGSGGITYRGNPQTDFKVSGSGRIGNA